MIPPGAIPPADTPIRPHNRHGFGFDQYGPRVPAVVVSPLIRPNLIDGRVHDHTAIPATLETIFGVSALTARDQAANNLDALLSLSHPRTDTPPTCPSRRPPVSLAVLRYQPASPPRH